MTANTQNSPGISLKHVADNTETCRLVDGRVTELKNKTNNKYLVLPTAWRQFSKLYSHIAKLSETYRGQLTCGTSIFGKHTHNHTSECYNTPSYLF